jgi:hypothetical protein
MIKAAIFMGDPRHIVGLSYNVGTCQASGVSILALKEVLIITNECSSHPGRPVSSALQLQRFSHTVMQLIHIAATETTPTRIKAMELSMARQL